MNRCTGDAANMTSAGRLINQVQQLLAAWNIVLGTLLLVTVMLQLPPTACVLKKHVFGTTTDWQAVDMRCCNSLECARAARGARGLP
jgi:hypothetical protein